MSSKAGAYAGTHLGRNDDVLFITKKKPNKKGNNKRETFDDAYYEEQNQYVPKDPPKGEYFPSNNKVVCELK